HPGGAGELRKIEAHFGERRIDRRIERGDDNLLLVEPVVRGRDRREVAAELPGEVVIEDEFGRTRTREVDRRGRELSRAAVAVSVVAQAGAILVPEIPAVSGA